jgi:hypothetical protein
MATAPLKLERAIGDYFTVNNNPIKSWKASDDFGCRLPTQDTAGV